jgi:hypothetical protein
LQDYFFADFIAFNFKKNEILQRIYDSERDSFLNMLDLFYELDYKTFRNVLVRRLLTDFINYYRTQYKNISNVAESDLHERRTISYGMKVQFKVGIPGKGLKSFMTNRHENKTGKAVNNSRMLQSANLSVTYFQTFKRQLIELLSDKQAKFITSDFNNKANGKTDLPIEELITLDDDPNSSLNLPGNFKNVNKILSLAYTNRGEQAYIDYKAAVTELNTIETEIGMEEKSDRFDDI